MCPLMSKMMLYVFCFFFYLDRFKDIYDFLLRDLHILFLSCFTCR